MKLSDIMSLPLNNSSYDPGETIGTFFYQLFNELWIQGERFNSKRPFGNGGWHYDIYAVLIRNGLIPGELDNDGYVDKVDADYAQNWVSTHIITRLFSFFIEP
jgi:hypothetical protein